jgi:hypothetical protein
LQSQRDLIEAQEAAGGFVGWGVWVQDVAAAVGSRRRGLEKIERIAETQRRFVRVSVAIEFSAAQNGPARTGLNHRVLHREPPFIASCGEQ